MRYLFTFLFSFSLSVFAVDFPKDKDCVAWKAKKIMFMVNTVWPVGLNCEIELLMRESDPIQIEAAARLSDFDSSEPERDQVVAELLSNDEHPSLKISTAVPSSAWRAIKSGEIKEWPVKLSIKGQEYPLVMALEVTEEDSKPRYLKGFYEGKLSDFDAEVPSVAGGLVASPRDFVELHFQIRIR